MQFIGEHIAPSSNARFERVVRSAALFLTLLVILVCIAPNVSAQQTFSPHPAPTPPDGEEIVRIDTDLIPIDVTVTNAEGQLVRGLRAEDFRVYEDGVERPVALFNIEQRGGVERPVAAVFVLDVSGSMRVEEIEQLRSSVRLFAERLARNSSVFAVVSFGMEVRVLQSFTSDLRRLDRAFDRLARDPNGLSSHAYDAVDDAIRLLARQSPRTRERRSIKRVVIVVSDGFPVGDTVSAQTVIERANAAQTSIYTVTLPSFSRLSSLGRPLEPTYPLARPLPTPLDISGLAERTGGRNSYATDRDYEAIFRQIAEEVTATYVLAFYPTETTRNDGRFHTIRVQAPPGLFIRQNRSSYQAVRNRS